MNVKTAELTFGGGSHFDAVTGSGRTLAFDDAVDGGLGPVETVVAALAACTAMDVISIALKKRQDVTAYRIHVRAEQREEYPMVLTRVDIVHEVVGPAVDVAAIERCIELSARKYCPISAMLSAGETEVHHRYRVARTDVPGAPPEEGEVVVTGPHQAATIVP